MKKIFTTLAICISLVLFSCTETNNTNHLNGTWKRTSATNGCADMLINFNGTEGTVTYSPAGCCFQTGDAKWNSYDPANANLQDLVRQISTCILQPYETSTVTFYNNYTEVNVGGVYYVKQ